MKCSKCGGEWFEEQKLIKPAAQPSENPKLMTVPRELIYRLVCADCGKPAKDKTSEQTLSRKAK